MIFISEPLIDWALRERIVGQDKIIKIYSGIDLNQFCPANEDVKNKIRQKWKLNRNDPVIGIVSKLWEGKGHTVLLEAFRALKKRITNARLVIVGEGYLYDDLLRMVKLNGLRDSVLFTGFQMDVSEILATFDVAVLPSFFEGMGRVLLEAMAMEKPVVASRVGGIPDLVKDGVNGVLVTPGNVQELAGAIEKIVTDKGLAQKMGREGRKRIKEQFSSEVMARSIERVYHELTTVKGIPFEN
jgi:glycosyltransferase involved in cell wall biosynthesis